MTETNDMDNGPVTGTDDTPITLEYTEVTVISDDLDAQQAAIDQTRGSIGETLDAIKDKLDPHLLMTEAKDAAANVMDKAKDTVHEVVSDVASHAKETAKEAVGGVVD